MNKLRQKLIEVLQGRNGVDELGRVLLIASTVLYICWKKAPSKMGKKKESSCFQITPSVIGGVGRLFAIAGSPFSKVMGILSRKCPAVYRYLRDVLLAIGAKSWYDREKLRCC